MSCQCGEDFPVVVGKPPACLVRCFADADDAAVQAMQRHGEQSLGSVAGFGIDFLVKKRMLIRVGDVDRLAAHRHRPGDSQPGIEAHDLAFLGNRRPKLAIFTVEQENANPLRLQQFLGFACD